MSSDQDRRGFLPPTTPVFSDELHPQPPSPTTTTTGNNLPRPWFTALTIPQTSPATPATLSSLSYSTQESHLATAIGRAICSIRDAVTAATAPAQNPIRRTKSDITQRSRTTARNPLRRTVSDTTIPPPPPYGSRIVNPCPNSRNAVSECLNQEESPKIKRSRKVKEMLTEIEQKCWEFRREFESEENVEDDKPSEVIADQDEAKEERDGFKQLEEGEEGCVEFKQLENGDLRIRLCCSCCRRYEIFGNQIGFFYRLI